MRLVPVLFPCDLGWSERGRYVPTGMRGAPDLMLDLLEGEGVRMARPASVPIVFPEDPDPADAALKLDAYVAKAIEALAGVVESVNAGGDFPLILGGDHTAMCGHVLAHAARHADGIGLAVLADAHLDLAAPGVPVYGDLDRLRKDATVTADGNAHRMVLSGALRMLPQTTAFGKAMARSSVVAAQTSVLGARSSEWAQIRAQEKRAGIEVWRMERVELDGESAYRSLLNRHLEAGPIALSIDVTGLDPHLMTAVTAPVSDGIDWSFLKRTLEQCVPHVDRLLGLDICQIDSHKDDVHHSAITRLVDTLVPFLQRLTR